MKRSSALNFANLAAFVNLFYKSPTFRRPAREERSRAEQVRRMGDAQMKRERRRERICGSST